MTTDSPSGSRPDFDRRLFSLRLDGFLPEFLRQLVEHHRPYIFEAEFARLSLRDDDKMVAKRRADRFTDCAVFQSERGIADGGGQFAPVGDPARIAAFGFGRGFRMLFGGLRKCDA